MLLKAYLHNLLQQILRPLNSPLKVNKSLFNVDIILKFKENVNNYFLHNKIICSYLGEQSNPMIKIIVEIAQAKR